VEGTDINPKAAYASWLSKEHTYNISGITWRIDWKLSGSIWDRKSGHGNCKIHAGGGSLNMSVSE